MSTEITAAYFIQINPPGRIPGICWQASLHSPDDHPPYPLAVAWLTDFRESAACGIGVSLDYVIVPDQFRRRGYATALITACRERWGDALWLTDSISEAGEGLARSTEGTILFAEALPIGEAADLASRPAQARDEHRSEAIIRRIRSLADQYERGGEPGPRGLNCWGWSEIARHLRAIADEASGTEYRGVAP